MLVSISRRPELAMQKDTLILGWDVGGTKCAVVAGDTSGTIHRRVEWRTADTPGDSEMIAAFVDRARDYAKAFGQFRGIGVSIGGPLNMRSGVILSPPHLPGWRNVPLREILQRELGTLCLPSSKPPISICHDAAACVLAEKLWGAAMGASHAIYLTCATGCGCGILIDGKVLMGPDGESPEIGFAKLTDSGAEMDFGGVMQSGHVEIYGSGSGIGRLARHLFPKKFATTPSAKELNELAASGDSDALAVLIESSHRMGQLCVTLGTLFSPQCILLGSLARYLGERWVSGIREYFKKNSLPANSVHTRVQPASLGDRLQDLSAIAPVLVDW